MQLDPRDERRLAFHLGCGWSGVLDLATQTITHVHAPANPALAGAGAGSPGAEPDWIAQAHSLAGAPPAYGRLPLPFDAAARLPACLRLGG